MKKDYVRSNQSTKFASSIPQMTKNTLLINLISKVHHLALALRANIFGSRYCVRQDISGILPCGNRRLCLFAHYSPDGEVAPWILHSLDSLRHEGFDIHFISTAEHLNEAALFALKNHCQRILIRQNVSLDFGSWKCAIDLIPSNVIKGYQQILLLNDSVYGSFGPIGPIFSEMADRKLDIWGLTESWEIAQHIQSYFLVFERPAIVSGFFSLFWHRFKYQWRKARLIRKGEVGLSEFARSQGRSIGAWIPAERLPDTRNPTLFHWNILIAEFAFPFLKTELPRLNRFQNTDVSRWRELVSKYFPNYPLDLIRQ